MAVRCFGVVKTDRPPSLLASCPPFVAVDTATPGVIAVFTFPFNASQNVSLYQSHEGDINALCMCEVTNGRVVLCSAGADGNICLRSSSKTACGFSSEEEDYLAAGGNTTILQNLYDVSGLAVSSECTRIAAAQGQTIHIIDIQSRRITFRLEGHDARVTSVAFHMQSKVISISEDRTFKIWDLAGSTVTYQSSIVSASPFVAMSHRHECGMLAVAAEDGIVRVYSISTGDYRLMSSLNVGVECRSLLEAANGREEERNCKEPVVISSKPSWKTAAARENDDDGATLPKYNVEDDCVIGLAFYSSDAFVGAFKEALTDWAEGAALSAMLVVVTSSALIAYDSHTWKPVFTSLLTDLPVECGDAKERVALARCFDASQQNATSSIWVSLSSAFHSRVYVLRVDRLEPVVVQKQKQEAMMLMQGVPPLPSAAASSSSVVLSVFPTTQPPEKSPLHLQCDASEDKKAASREILGRSASSAIAGPKGKKPIVDQPVTFHGKVKSSGYATPPAFTTLGGKTKSKVSKKGGKSDGGVVRRYPEDSEAPIHRQGEVGGGARIHQSPVLALAYATSAKKLASASADRTLCVLDAPLRKATPSYMTGHNGTVKTVCWSHSHKLLLSSSADRTAIIWSPSKSVEPTLIFNRRKCNVTKNTQPHPENMLHDADVCAARFYYVDKFVVMGIGNRLMLYSYKLRDDALDDIERLRKEHKYSLAARVSIDAQSLIDITCPNSFLSYLVLCAASNRSVAVVDMSVAKVVHTFEEVHSRAASCVVINDASSYASQQSASYDLFLTSAPDGLVKMWDLRSKSNVIRFSGHVNRSLPLSCAFSPCLRYIASGSEDRQAYLYDIRKGTFVHKLGGHTDVVSAVAFNPLFPQLATASHDGGIRTYADRPTSE